MSRVTQIAVLAPFVVFSIAAMAEEAEARSSPDSGASASASSAADNVARGRSLYARHCARCHGFSMVTSGTVTYDLRKFPPNEKARFLNSVTNGKGQMPPWKGTLSGEQMDQLWAYVLTGGKR